MDPALADEVFLNPLIFEKITSHLLQKSKLPLRQVSKGFNKQVFAIIESGKFCPKLKVNLRTLQQLDVTDINQLLCAHVHFTEPSVDWDEAGNAKEAFENFFLTFHDHIKTLRYTFNPRSAFWMFEDIWNRFALSSLKVVFLAMDYLEDIPEQEIELLPKESVEKLSLNYKQSFVQPIILKVMNASPNLKKIGLGLNAMFDLCL